MCSVETHDKPALVFHLANTIARARAGVKEFYSLNRAACQTSSLETQESMDRGDFKTPKDKAGHPKRPPNPTSDV